MLNSLNKRSGNHVSLVVVDDSAKFDGVMVDDQRLYIRSDVLESGDFSNTSIHEYGHSVEGTKAYKSLTQLLEGDNALKKSAQNKFYSASEYGVTEEELVSILEKNDRGESITNEEADKYELFTSEVGANLIAGELGNEAFIDKIVRLDEGAARKLIGKIKEMKSAIKSLESKESREKYRRLRRAEKLFLQAAEQSGNGTKYKNHRILMTNGSEYVFEIKKDAEPTFAGVKGDNHRQGPAISSASNTIIPQNPEKSTPRVKKSKKIIDADYMTAVESGDMETAQRMVDEESKEGTGKNEEKMQVREGEDHKNAIFSKVRVFYCFLFAKLSTASVSASAAEATAAT